MGRDYDPVQGKWYQDLEENEVFQVLSVDPDEELIELQYENGDIEEIDLEHAQEPEGWSSDDDDDKEEVEEEDDDEDDWDEDEDDDWDDDDEDLDDEDDYGDREQ